MRKSVYFSVRARCVSASIGCLAVIAIWYYTTPWTNNLEKRFRPLSDYRVRDDGTPAADRPTLHSEKWRVPNSRWELLLTRDEDVHYPIRPSAPIKPENASRTPPAKPSPPEMSPPVPRVRWEDGDTLTDFVVDQGNCYSCPATEFELRGAIAERKAYRASHFFLDQVYLSSKPFYGEIPAWRCLRESGHERELPRVARLQFREGVKLVDAALPTPDQPEVYIVAAASSYNMHQAAFRRDPPIAYPQDQYWAVVFAGIGGSGPTKFLLDKAEVRKESATISIYQPPRGVSTCDIHAYWFFVPLGRLPEGPYSVNVRDVTDGTLSSTLTAKLRWANAQEVEERRARRAEEQQLRELEFARLKRNERAHGAAMQLHLERLAEFVHRADLPDDERQLLTNDVLQLGKSVNWEQNIYGSNHSSGRKLAAPTPGKGVKMPPRHPITDAGSPPWQASEISLKDIWLCDGTDARWYAGATYRDVPEFNGALDVESPSRAQQKIREIWNVLREKYKERDSYVKGVNSFPAAGSINDALDAAYRVFVAGEVPKKEFATDQSMWVILVARKSFLVRAVQTRFYVDKYSGVRRREFRIGASAYIRWADDPSDQPPAPLTFALIPLGRLVDLDSVGVMFTCPSVCSRPVGADQPKLLDATPPQFLHTTIGHYLGQPAGFRMESGPTGRGGR